MQKIFVQWDVFYITHFKILINFSLEDDLSVIQLPIKKSNLSKKITITYHIFLNHNKLIYESLKLLKLWQFCKFNYNDLDWRTEIQNESLIKIITKIQKWYLS